jgi:threonine dehydratase
MNGGISMDTIPVKSVWQARKRLFPYLPKTPLVYSAPLSGHCQTPVWLKLETLQPSGSFKLRGAMNVLLSMSAESRQKGVAAFSTGNHGLAVAYAAKQAKTPATIFVSEAVPTAKQAALQASGATLTVTGRSQDEAGAACIRHCEQTGQTLVPPFDDDRIIAGQGTLALELLDDLPELDTVIAGLSGGGLLSGIGLVMKHTDPTIQVAGASIVNGAAMEASLAAGHPVEVAEQPTVADSLLGGIGLDNRWTFKAVQRYVDTRVQVPEEDIAKAMAYLYEHHHLIVEGAAAIGAAALLTNSIRPKGPTAVVITGASIHPKEHHRIIRPYL